MDIPDRGKRKESTSLMYIVVEIYIKVKSVLSYTIFCTCFRKYISRLLSQFDLCALIAYFRLACFWCLSLLLIYEGSCMRWIWLMLQLTWLFLVLGRWLALRSWPPESHRFWYWECYFLGIYWSLWSLNEQKNLFGKRNILHCAPTIGNIILVV